jgi:antitoxin (DNA-binding transcriptional repressor) of toxin-antitoxin stability system
MRIAKISELKAKLSAHIAYVKNGEEVLILDRNTPVARLVAAGMGEEQDARTRRLIAKGVLTPPKVARPKGYRLPRPAGSHCISQEVMDQIWREERDGR